MSRGVATIFKKKFGKPSLSDGCNRLLTLQKTSRGAAVYGLVTKQKFILKPRDDEYMAYNAAFQELAEEFQKSKTIKWLICPPMECVRDLILYHQNILHQI